MDLGEVNRNLQGTPVVAKATKGEDHVAEQSPEQASVTPALL